MAIRVTVWGENVHEQKSELVRSLYPQGIHTAIAAALTEDPEIVARTATLQQPEHGLTEAVLAETDVLSWWGHAAHGMVDDAIVDRVQKRVLEGIPKGPALVRAQKVGNRCGKVGFDWPGWEGSFAKVEEEVTEVLGAVRAQDANAVHDEIGDLLLAVVNLSRKLGVDAENALLDATHRFERRFEFVEDRLAERGKTPQQSTLEEMDSLWNDAKKSQSRRGA